MRKRRNAPATGVPVANPAEAIFTVPELARRWRVNRHTVTAAIVAGRLQAFVVSERGYRIRATEVARYEQQHMQTKAAS